jgi:hypothetical protein
MVLIFRHPHLENVVCAEALFLGLRESHIVIDSVSYTQTKNDIQIHSRFYDEGCIFRKVSSGILSGIVANVGISVINGKFIDLFICREIKETNTRFFICRSTFTVCATGIYAHAHDVEIVNTVFEGCRNLSLHSDIGRGGHR